MTNTPETLNILTPDFRMPEHCGGDRWSILHGDSLQILRQFVPNSFDAIITDPPYASGGSSQTTKNRSTNEKYSSMSKEKALPDFDSDQMDQLSWMFWTAAWLQDARRIAKPGAPVCLFVDWRQLPAMTLALQWAGWTWRGVAVWDKVASRPQKGRFRQQSEYIVWGSNGKMPLERNVGCLPGVFRYPNPQNRINNVGFWDSIPLWAVTLIGGLLITVLSFTMILTVYGRMFSLWMYAAIAPIPLSTFAGEPTSSVGKNFIRSYAGVCLQGVVIALSCIIFSAISSSPPAVDTGASVVTAVWTYVGELAFNLLVLVGAIKGCDRIVKEIMGL